MISSAILAGLETKLKEVWQIHGLDPDFPLTVTTSSRSVDDINQVIDSVPNETIVTRM